MATEERWRERFGEFEATFARLRGALEADGEMSELERGGVIHCFTSTFACAWYTLKERLEYDGIRVETAGNRRVIREALNAGLIDDHETWFAMLNDRNKMTHTYGEPEFEALGVRIHARYLAALGDFHMRFAGDMVDA